METEVRNEGPQEGRGVATVGGVSMAVEIVRMDPRELKLLEQNARFMTHEQFQLLVKNIKHDGALTSTPFAWWDGSKFEVLSGNHRVKASIAAGLESIFVMTTRDELSYDQRMAIQLSHNAITGQDDPATLKALYESIGSVDMKVYAGLDDKTLNLLDKVSPISFSEAALEAKILSVYFLPEEIDKAQAIISTVLENATGDRKWMARYEQYDQWLDAIAAAGSARGVSNAATSLMIVLDIFSAHIGELAEYLPQRKDKDLFPLASILGSNQIPASTAKALQANLQKIIDGGKAATMMEAFGVMLKGVDE